MVCQPITQIERDRMSAGRRKVWAEKRDKMLASIRKAMTPEVRATQAETMRQRYAADPVAKQKMLDRLIGGRRASTKPRKKPAARKLAIGGLSPRERNHRAKLMRSGIHGAALTKAMEDFKCRPK